MSVAVAARQDLPKFVAALTALSLVSVLSALDQTVVATALPHIVSDLQGASLLGWVFTAYFVGATATVAVVGKLSDLLGRRRVFIANILLFAIGSLLCGMAANMPLLVLFRGIQGIGAGGIQTCSIIVMGDMFSPRERGKWQVINSIGFATASAIGPTIGGVLSDNTSWRWIFLLNVPVCAITIAALLYGLADTLRPKQRPAIDWAGGGWSIVVVVLMLLGLTWGGREYAWTSPMILGIGAATVVTLFCLWQTERRAPEPVLPASLLRGNLPSLSALAGAGNSMVWFGMILLVPLRLQLVLGDSATAAGALLTPGIVTGPVCSFIAGQMLARSGRYRMASLIAGTCQVLGVGMLFLAPPQIGQLWVVAFFVVTSIGTGFGGPTFMIIYQNAVPQRKLGAGIGMFSLFRQFGASVGTALAGSIVGGGVAAAAGSTVLAPLVQQAFMLPLAAGVVVLLAAWFTADRPLRTSTWDAEDEFESNLSMFAAEMA